jgi:hypothetical protein
LIDLGTPRELRAHVKTIGLYIGGVAPFYAFFLFRLKIIKEFLKNL